MRPEDFWLKDSEKFCVNPLKDEAKAWIIFVLFGCTATIVLANLIKIWLW